MRINIIVTLALISLLALAACDAGESPRQVENDCPTTIGDGTFDGPYRAVLGFGEGAHAALRLAFASPNRFNVVVAMDGPTNARRLLADLEAQLIDFDNWPELPTRSDRIEAWRDLLGAFGNPLYENAESNFYPPGLNASDFAPYRPKVLPGIISPDNPDGSIPAVTIKDTSGLPVDFAVALDLNGNGLRDTGEPIIMQMHEPFVDANGNGWYDEGESFDNVGLDGVPDTGDYGEANGVFDYHPLVANWLANDPLSLAAEADIDLTPGYRQSTYLDALTDDEWGYRAQMSSLADLLSDRLDSMDEGEDFCIVNRLGRFDRLLTDVPVLEDKLWFGDKFVYFELPGNAENAWSDDETELRIARWSQALSFISDRMPNGLPDNVRKESAVVWQIRSFHSEELQRDVDFGIGFPAGYFDAESSWKSYPVIYVFHDRQSTIHDWYELLERQGDLAHRLLVKQALIVVVDGSRDVDENRGYGYYVNQAAPEIGGAYGAMVDELIDYVESTFRVQFDIIHHDED